MSVWIRAGGPKVDLKPNDLKYYKYDGELHFSTATYDCVVLCDKNERGAFVELQADKLQPKFTNSFYSMSEVDPLTNSIKPRQLSWIINHGKGTLVEKDHAYIAMDTLSKKSSTKRATDDPFDYVTPKVVVDTFDEEEYFSNLLEEEQRKQQHFYEQLKQSIDDVFTKKDRVIREGMTSSGAIKPVLDAVNNALDLGYKLLHTKGENAIVTPGVTPGPTLKSKMMSKRLDGLEDDVMSIHTVPDTSILDTVCGVVMRVSVNVASGDASGGTEIRRLEY